MRLNRKTATTIGLVLALTAPTSGQLAARAQSDADTPSSFNITDPAQASDPIAKLELRIFDHTYKADSQEARLKRLENFVFGAAQTGDTQVRLSKLQESVTASAASSAPNSSDSGSQKAAEAPSPPKPTFDEADYPRVDQLEQQILGQQHSHEILSGRLARLEAKAFGQASNSTDPADRVDALDAYVARHDIYGQGGQNVGQTTPYTQSPAASSPYTSSPYQSSPYTSSQPSASPYASANSGYGSSYSGTAPAQSAYPGTPPAGSSYPGTHPGSVSQAGQSTPYTSPYPTGTNSPYGQAASAPNLQANITSTNDRLASMEKTEFGRDYSTHSLKDRVQRLEKKVDPNKTGHEGQSLPARVDQLWAVVSVSNSIGSAPIASSAANGYDKYSANANNQQNNYGNKPHHSLLHSVGKVLGTAAVIGGSGAMMMGGMGGMGMGMGGLGGMSRYGMGGYGSPYGYGSNYGSYPSYGSYGGYGSGYGGYGNGLGRF